MGSGAAAVWKAEMWCKLRAIIRRRNRYKMTELVLVPLLNLIRDVPDLEVQLCTALSSLGVHPGGGELLEL